MAQSKCPHCGTARFELKQASPTGASYKSYLIQCSKCGAPFAAQEYYNTGALMEEQKKTIAELSRKVDQLDHNIRAILQVLDHMRRQ